MLFQIVKKTKNNKIITHVYTQRVHLSIYVTQDPNHAPTQEEWNINSIR